MTLEELDDKFRSDFTNNKKSLFRLSFELTRNDKDQLSQCRDLELPYLRMACWLSDFHEYGDGFGYRKCWTELGSNAKSRVDHQRVWDLVYGNEHLDRNAFRSKAWMLLGEVSGPTSVMWEILRLVLNKQENLDGDLFQTSTYINDSPPEFLNRILSDDRSHPVEKEEFVEFIMALRKRNYESEMWYKPLLDVFRSKFDKFVGASTGFFLRWSGLETAEVDIIVGFDHVKPHGKLKAKLDGNEIAFAPPYRSFRVENVRTKHVLEYRKRDQKLQYDGSPYGAYVRYVNGARDSRNTWWKKVQSDGAVRYETRDILLCLSQDCDVHRVFSDAGFEIESWRYCLRFSGETTTTQFILVHLVTRPDNCCSLNFGGFTVDFVGKRPVLGAQGHVMERVSLDDGQLFGGDVDLAVENIPNLLKCRWSIEGESCRESDAKIRLYQDDSRIRDIWIKCTPVDADGRCLPSLHRHIVILPDAVAAVLESGTPNRLPAGWELKDTDDPMHFVVYRMQNLKEYELVSALGDKMRLLFDTAELDWWFESAEWIHDEAPHPSRCAEFDGFGKLDGYVVCFPGNIGDLRLEIHDGEIDVSNYPVIDSVRRIPLSEVFHEAMSFVVRGAGGDSRLLVNGTTVCSVKPIPSHPVVWEKDGQFEVFLPRKERGRRDKYRVLIYNDDLSETEMVKSADELIQPVLWDRSEDDRHIPLGDAIAKYCQVRSTGELHVVLVPERLYLESPTMACVPFFLHPSAELGGEFCPVVRVKTRNDSALSDEGLKGFTAMQSIWKPAIEKLPRAHPYRTSRLFTLDSGFCNDVGFGYWEGFAGCPAAWESVLWNMLAHGINFLVDKRWTSQRVYKLVQKSAKVMGLEGRRLSNPGADVYLAVCRQLVDNNDSKPDRNILRGAGICSVLLAFERIENNGRYVLEERNFRPGEWRKKWPQQIVELTSLSRFEQVERGSIGVNAMVSFPGGEAECPVQRICAGVVDTTRGVVSSNNGMTWTFGCNPDVELTGYRLDKSADGWLALFKRFKHRLADEDDESGTCSRLEVCTRLDALDALFGSLVDLFPHENQRSIASEFYGEYQKYGCIDLSAVGRGAVIVATVRALHRLELDLDDILKPGKSGYDALLAFIRELYRAKFIEDRESEDLMPDIEWRELMRICTFTYSQFHYLLRLPSGD